MARAYIVPVEMLKAEGKTEPALSDTLTSKAVLAMFGLLAPDLPPPSVMPMNNGVQLEWHTGGVDIEVYIATDQATTFYRE